MCLSASGHIHSALCLPHHLVALPGVPSLPQSLSPFTALPSGELLLILGDLAHPDVSRRKLHSQMQLRALTDLCLGP